MEINSDRIFKAIMDRPYDKAAPPVVIPDNFRCSVEVYTFMEANNRRLTWEQVDELLDLQAALKAREDQSRRPEVHRAPSPEEVLTAAWRDACSATEDNADRLAMVAEAACRLLGASGGRQLDRILKLYRELGMKATNRGVLELVREDLTPEQRFKFVEYRARLQRSKAAKESTG